MKTKMLYCRQNHDRDFPDLVTGTKPLSFFEFWPKRLFYFPVQIYVCYLMMRYRGVTLPTVANPLFDMGGFVGESKAQILRQIPKELSASYCPFFTSKRLATETVLQTVEKIEKRMKEAKIEYPCIIKPDIGACGAGVRKVDNRLNLIDYIDSFPFGSDFLVQKLSAFENEVGLFYMREPGQEKGEIFSLTLKYFPIVRGDGVSTLEDLIKNDERAGSLFDVYKERHQERLKTIPAKGEDVRLAFAGSHSRGAIFKDGSCLLTKTMEDKWDRFCKQIPEFYCGRFDVRFDKISDLQNCENIEIVEINGSGAEATHIWDSHFSLMDAYRVLFKQFKLTYKIGAMNVKRGFRPASLKELLRRAKVSKELEERYPYTS